MRLASGFGVIAFACLSILGCSITGGSGASSGDVGGPHKEPNIACYFVTKLDKAILRMVDIEMSGVYHEPAAADVLRTGGDPKSGVCQLEGGQVRIY